MRLPVDQKKSALFIIKVVEGILQDRLEKFPPLSVDVGVEAFRAVRQENHGTEAGFEWLAHVFEVMRSREARREKRRLATKEEKTA